MKKVLFLVLTFVLMSGTAFACSDVLSYTYDPTDSTVTCLYNTNRANGPILNSPCAGLRGDFLKNCKIQNEIGEYSKTKTSENPNKTENTTNMSEVEMKKRLLGLQMQLVELLNQMVTLMSVTT